MSFPVFHKHELLCAWFWKAENRSMTEVTTWNQWRAKTYEYLRVTHSLINVQRRMEFNEIRDVLVGKKLENISAEFVDSQWTDPSKYVECDEHKTQVFLLTLQNYKSVFWSQDRQHKHKQTFARSAASEIYSYACCQDCTASNIYVSSTKVNQHNFLVHRKTIQACASKDCNICRRCCVVQRGRARTAHPGRLPPAQGALVPACRAGRSGRDPVGE